MINNESLANIYDEYLLLVNRTHQLNRNYIPLDLEYVNVSVDVVDEKKFMRKEAAVNLRHMFSDALRQGCSLMAISGFRSYNRQKEIYENSIATKGELYTKKYIAYPGTSEHQTGLAMDVSSLEMNGKLEEEFSYTKEGRWVKMNAYKYGFIIRYPLGSENITGYGYEPWHIRYVGREHSWKMISENINTLEEYIDNKKSN